MDKATIANAIDTALRARGPGNTICPSEVARALAPEWRPLMPEIRAVAQSLADAGRITITQRGHPVRATTARGPIRLSLPSSD